MLVKRNELENLSLKHLKGLDKLNSNKQTFQMYRNKAAQVPFTCPSPEIDRKLKTRDGSERTIWPTKG